MLDYAPQRPGMRSLPWNWLRGRVREGAEAGTGPPMVPPRGGGTGATCCAPTAWPVLTPVREGEAVT